ncbi:IclR family transcriptional regulator [Pseudonocardia sp. GCM10023141]|uniref:IclR family transcriptional regulator n=1 Tax=Pseudonocardia sp. GCM10023141 TaxID=3252653 RepID=UPI003616E088
MERGRAERDPVGKALGVLIALADDPDGPWSVRSLARDLDTSPATVHRIFTAFEGRNLLDRDGDGGYQAGAELFRLCGALRDGFTPLQLARTHVDALARDSGEAVLFGAYEPARRQMMFVDVVQAVHPLQYDVGLHRWIPVHSGASGLAILAFLPEAERRAVYAAGLPRLTSATIVSAEALEAECVRIRERGYAISVAQRLSGAAAVTAPVFDAVGDVVGDVSITVPEQRFHADREAPLAQRVMTTARAVTDELSRAGYRRG